MTTGGILKFLALCMGLASISTWANTVNYNYSSFDEAQKAQTFLRFDMKSTNVGLITTSFQGFVKKFSLNYVLEGDKVKFAKLTLPIEQMDTDMDLRNNKMWEQCLDYRKHPELAIILTETVPIDNLPHSVPATISVRGQPRSITLVIKARRDGRKILAEIDGELSLKDLDIPAPSIFIAKVRDRVNLKAALEASD